MQIKYFKVYLLVVIILRREVPIPLTINGRIGAPSNSIYLPPSVVIVHNMKVPKPAPWHTLL